MTKYYYIDNATKQQYGPIALSDLASRNINSETMVWCPGMADWTNAGSVGELAYLFNKNINTPIPPAQKINPNRSTIQTTGQNPQQGKDSDSAKWNDVIPMPKNWLVESILLSILCCSPISIVGIFYAAKVESLYYAKDYNGAVKAAQNAKIWSLVGMIFIPACYMILLIFGTILGAIF